MCRLAASYEENVEEVLGAARPVQLSATASPSRPKKGRRAKKAAAGMVAPASSGARTLAQSSPVDLLAGGNLLRQEVALTMIHENQRALRRCEALVAPSALPDLANRIFQTLLQGLGVAYMKVSLELATDAISSKSDLKKNVDLSMQFLNVVEDANSIVYLLMKHFWYAPVRAFCLPTAAPQQNRLGRGVPAEPLLTHTPPFSRRQISGTRCCRWSGRPSTCTKPV